MSLVLNRLKGFSKFLVNHQGGPLDYQVLQCIIEGILG